jgi:hypothetical protein
VADVSDRLKDGQGAVGHADLRTTRRYDRGHHSLDRHSSHTVTIWLAEPASGTAYAAQSEDIWANMK